MGFSKYGLYCFVLVGMFAYANYYGYAARSVFSHQGHQTQTAQRYHK